jgi:hypothetical protein
MLRHSFGLACHVDTQPITYFLADSGTANAVDLNIIRDGWTGHEIFLAGLAAVKTPGFKGITATRGQLFRSCSVVFRWRSCRRFAQANARIACRFEVQAIAPGVNK